MLCQRIGNGGGEVLMLEVVHMGGDGGGLVLGWRGEKSISNRGSIGGVGGASGRRWRRMGIVVRGERIGDLGMGEEGVVLVMEVVHQGAGGGWLLMLKGEY